ncbi:hypothetical protein BGX29_004205 [Mortierella sp. GBA35]|nr:hypothetical protein BGX29_004205 [Mortierella sp. GBA35]
MTPMYSSHSFPASPLSIGQTLVAPELHSMCPSQAPDDYLLPLPTPVPVAMPDIIDQSSCASPFQGGVQHSHDHFHHHHYQHHYRHSYQPNSAFQDLEDAQHLTMLQDIIRQSNRLAEDPTEAITPTPCAIHPTIRRTQSLETFSTLDRRMNMAMSMADSIMYDNAQSYVSSLPGSPMCMGSPLMQMSEDYSSALHQGQCQLASSPMPFDGDLSGSTPPTALSSPFTPTFQTALSPSFSAESSCHSPSMSTSSPTIDHNNVSLNEIDRSTPYIQEINYNNYTFGGNYNQQDHHHHHHHPYSQHHCQVSTDGRQSSVDTITDAHSDTDTSPLNSRKPRIFICTFPDCKRTFSRPYNLKSHAMTHGSFRPFPCNLCDRSFARIHDRDRHMSSHRQMKAYHCIVCMTRFARQDAVIRHLKLSNEMNSCSWILKAQGITFRDVAAGRVTRQSLGREDDILRTVETLEEQLRKTRANRAFDLLKYPKPATTTTDTTITDATDTTDTTDTTETATTTV